MEDIFQEPTTLYYSNFSILGQEESKKLIKYFYFKQSLLLVLGMQWSYYAARSFFQETFWGQEFLSDKIVFTFAFETWASLKLRHEDDKISTNLSENSTTGTKISGVSNDQNILSFKNFYHELLDNFDKYKKDDQALNAVSRAFFESAVSLWNNCTVENNIMDNNDSYFGNAVTRTKQTILRPLLSTSVKIFNKFNDIKGSLVNGMSSKLSIPNTPFSNQTPEQRELSDNCNQMSLDNPQSSQNKRKDFSFDDKNEGSGMSIENFTNKDSNSLSQNSNANTGIEKNEIVEMNEMGLAHQQLVTLEYVHRLVDHQEDYIHNSRGNWQVTNHFVTYIVELKDDKLKMLNKRIGYFPNQNLRIRFQQPAGNFYHRLIELYLQTISVRQIAMEEFVKKVQKFFGMAYRDQYLEPTIFFYNIQETQWTKQNIYSYNPQQQMHLLSVFVKSVREQMSFIWDQKIVQKVKNMKVDSRKSSSIDTESNKTH